jgi:hypothetical protein
MNLQQTIKDRLGLTLDLMKKCLAGKLSLSIFDQGTNHDISSYANKNNKVDPTVMNRLGS